MARDKAAEVLNQIHAITGDTGLFRSIRNAAGLDKVDMNRNDKEHDTAFTSAKDRLMKQGTLNVPLSSFNGLIKAACLDKVKRWKLNPNAFIVEIKGTHVVIKRKE